MDSIHEIYHMDEINQMMKFQNMDETTFLNEKYCHPYVNVCECEIYILISLQTFLLYLGSKYMSIMRHKRPESSYAHS